MLEMYAGILVFWVDKFESWDFLGTKYEPLSDLPPLPLIIKKSEWGPWDNN